MPDRVWGPSWVVWRQGPEHCGWAPLPPGAMYDVASANFVFGGRQVGLEFDFGLGWHHFNFCLLRELGERPRARFRSEVEIRGVFGRTTLVNRYSVVRLGEGGGHPMVFNHGVEPARVSAVRGRPLETVIVRDASGPRPGAGRERYDARGHTLEVYRPRFHGH
jgi:hypothetical protein